MRNANSRPRDPPYGLMEKGLHLCSKIFIPYTRMCRSHVTRCSLDAFLPGICGRSKATTARL